MNVQNGYVTMNDIILKNATEVSISNTEQKLEVKNKTAVVITSQSSVSGITDIPTPCVIDVLSTHQSSDVSCIEINTSDEVNICNSSEIPLRNVDGIHISRDSSTDSQHEEMIDGDNMDHATDFSMLPPTEGEESFAQVPIATAPNPEPEIGATLQKMNYVSMNDMERITSEANDNKWKLNAAPSGLGTPAKYEIRSKKASYVSISEIKARKNGLPLKSQDTAKPTDSKIDGDNRSSLYEDIRPMLTNFKKRITTRCKERAKLCKKLGLKVTCVVTSMLCCLFMGLTISQYVIPKTELQQLKRTTPILNLLMFDQEEEPDYYDFTTMETVEATEKDWSLSAHTPYNWRKVIVNNGTKYNGCLIRAGLNNIPGMVKCLEEGVNIQSIQRSFYLGTGTVLMFVSKNNMYAETVKFLLYNGANVNITNPKKETALHFCSQSDTDNVETMEILLQAGAAVDATDINGESALHIAASKGHEKMVHKLLEYDANYSVGNNIGETPLFKCIGRKPLANILKILIKAGADVNAVNLQGYNALQKLLQQIRVSSNNEEFGDMAGLLIDAKINTNVKDERGNSVLMLVALRSYNNILMYLVEDESCDINAVNKYGHSALISVTKLGNFLGVLLLLGAGADIHITDKMKQSALHFACGKGSIPIIKSLLRRKGGIDVKAFRGQTPLMYAIEGGHGNAVEVLLRYKPNLEITNTLKGYTALHVACSKGNADISKLLLKRNADINAKDRHGETPLMVAVSNDHIMVVQVLLSYKADLGIKNSKGSLVYNKVRNRKMSELLSEHKQKLNL